MAHEQAIRAPGRADLETLVALTLRQAREAEGLELERRRCGAGFPSLG